MSYVCVAFFYIISYVCVPCRLSCPICVLQGLPVRLFPWLYIGSVQHAGNGSQLSQLGVTAMLNVSRTVSPTAHSGPFRYHSIPVDDDHAADISRWFPDAIEFIGNISLTLKALNDFMKTLDAKGFFQFEIIMNVLVKSF